MDRRMYPANERVAHERLRGQVEGVTFTTGSPATVKHPVVSLFDEPGGKQDRQRLMGETVTVLEARGDWSFVICTDGYVGYICSHLLGPYEAQTHRVGTFATHVYMGDSFKVPIIHHLTFGAQVKVVDERPKFFETPTGMIPKKHLRPLDRPFEDPATIAQLHFNTPYLWGGNSTLGIDCSGLIQAALSACDLPCPGDSDMQHDVIGEHIPQNAPLRRGDLMFWKGHVGMMVDESTLIHANAHHMACVYEPIAAAIIRIEAQGDGPVIARKRLSN